MAGVNSDEYNVSWNKKFKDKLKVKSELLYKFWENLDQDPHFWILEAGRQHIAHRSTSVISSEADENGNINLLSLAVRYRYVYKKDGKREPKLTITGKSIELLDELAFIGKFLESKFEELKTLDRS